MHLAHSGLQMHDDPTLYADWKSVPITLTPEMIKAFLEECRRQTLTFGYPLSADAVSSVWRATLDASPKAGYSGSRLPDHR